jgi:hypothetical protein
MQTGVVDQPVVLPYSVNAFNSLPEFHESKASVASKMEILDAFGDIIRAHGAQKYLGAALIHKHFELYAEERIVESVTSHGSSLSARRNVTEDLTPYLWHLSHPGLESPRWTPVEFVLSNSIPSKIQKFADSLVMQSHLMRELGSLLSECGAQDTFGLALLHRQNINFDRDRQILLESPGTDERSLQVSAVSPSIVESDDYTQTYWHFDVDEQSIINGCSQHGCAGYCSLHKP